MAAYRNVHVPIAQPPPELMEFAYITLPVPEEWETMKICYVLFFLKIYKVLMKLHLFLCYKGLASSSDQNIDLKDLLGITKQENLNDPTGFLPHFLPPNYLQEAISTRNDTDHLNLNNIEKYWPTRIQSYAALCESINNHETATEIKTVSNQICAGNLSGIVQFAFSFSWTFSNSQGVGISLIMYAILLRYLAKVVRAFLIGKLGIQDITLDLHANLKFIIDQLLKNKDFIDGGGFQRDDVGLFQKLFATRLCYAHGWFQIAWNDWEVQLQGIVDALQLLKATTEAAQVKLIFDKLVRCKNEGLVVTSQEFNIMEF
jgi:hypothetical protein